jgi:hypothetical protein
VTDLEKGTIIFSSVAAILFALVAHGLWSGKTLGIAFRSRLIARRRLEPALYWASLAILSVFGLVAVTAVVSNLHLQRVF